MIAATDLLAQVIAHYQLPLVALATVGIAHIYHNAGSIFGFAK